ncbi:MAG: flagellar hook-length control protein FliK [Pseudomonadota bacterium]
MSVGRVIFDDNESLLTGSDQVLGAKNDFLVQTLEPGEDQAPVLETAQALKASAGESDSAAEVGSAEDAEKMVPANASAAAPTNALAGGDRPDSEAPVSALIAATVSGPRAGTQLGRDPSQVAGGSDQDIQRTDVSTTASQKSSLVGLSSQGDNNSQNLIATAEPARVKTTASQVEAAALSDENLAQREALRYSPLETENAQGIDTQKGKLSKENTSNASPGAVPGAAGEPKRERQPRVGWTSNASTAGSSEAGASEARASKKTVSVAAASNMQNTIASQNVAVPVDMLSDTGPGASAELRSVELDETVKLANADRTRPEPVAARSIVNQVIQSVSRAPGDAVIEVRLQPEELGRVRLAMSPGDVGITVQVNADRPETLDLLRRNIDALEQELKENGFTDMSFSFGSDTSGEPDGSKARDDHVSVVLSEEQPGNDTVPGDRPKPTIVPETGRVDIRI